MSRHSQHNQGIPFAFRHADKRMVTPQDVEKGLRCGCVCSHCGAPLVARKGPQRVWHFAHHARSECPGGFETAVHEMAKQLVVDRKVLWVPARALERRVRGLHSVWTEMLSLEVQAAGVVSLANCVQEQAVASVSDQALGLRRPDISAIFNGVPIAIEIRNTHAVDDEKLEWLQACGLSTVEIQVSDLSDLDSESITAELEQRLFLPSDSSKWLLHFGDAEALLRLDENERSLRAARADEEAIVLAERSQQLAKDNSNRQFRDDVREIEHTNLPLGPSATLRIARSRIRCTVKWHGYPPANTIDLVRNLAHRFSGRFNRQGMRWELYRREGCKDLYAQLIDLATAHLVNPFPDTPLTAARSAATNAPPPIARALPDPNDQERFDERAAIMEFDGNLSRAIAEERAQRERRGAASAWS